MSSFLGPAVSADGASAMRLSVGLALVVRNCAVSATSQAASAYTSATYRVLVGLGAAQEAFRQACLVACRRCQREGFAWRSALTASTSVITIRCLLVDEDLSMRSYASYLWICCLRLSAIAA